MENDYIFSEQELDKVLPTRKSSSTSSPKHNSSIVYRIDSVQAARIAQKNAALVEAKIRERQKREWLEEQERQKEAYERERNLDRMSKLATLQQIHDNMPIDYRASVIKNNMLDNFVYDYNYDSEKKQEIESDNIFSIIGNAINNADLKNVGERIKENEINYKDGLRILGNGIKRKIELHSNTPVASDLNDNSISNYDYNYLGGTPLSKYKARLYPNYHDLYFDLDDEITKREEKTSKETLERKFLKDITKNNKSYPHAFKIPGTELRSEVIPLNNRKGTFRDSTDHTPVKNTIGSVITFFGGNSDTFDPYDKNKKYADYDGYFNSSVGYVGLDDNDNLKLSSNPKDFANGNWNIRKIPYYDVINFNEVNNIPKIGNYDKQNPYSKVPLVKVKRNGETYDSYLPILTQDNLNYFGGAHGGQVIMQVGDKTFYVSGSVNKIHDTFNKLKKHYNVDSVRIYLLDNGTFNYGLKPKNGEVSSELHKQYGLSNTRGGDAVFLYK